MLDGQRKNSEICGRGMCCSSSGVADVTGKGPPSSSRRHSWEPKAPLPILYFVDEEAIRSTKLLSSSLALFLWFLKKGINFLTANREEATCPPLHVSIFSLNLNQHIFLIAGWCRIWSFFLIKIKIVQIEGTGWFEPKHITEIFTLNSKIENMYSNNI